MTWPAASPASSGPGESYTFTIAPGVLESLRANTVKQAEQTVDRRVNELGVTEPLIAIQGAATDEILLQLPGVADMDRARSILGATALLEWKLVEQGPASTREALLAATGGEVPPNTEVAIGVADAGGERRAGSTTWSEASQTSPDAISATHGRSRTRTISRPWHSR